MAITKAEAEGVGVDDLIDRLIAHVFPQRKG